MHNYHGIGHGDLHSGNIVCDTEGEPFIIDFEHAYEIHNHSWETELWMRTGYYWNYTYREFVNHDYNSWRVNLEVNDSAPRDHVPVSEEYYKTRFDFGVASQSSEALLIGLSNETGGKIYGVSLYPAMGHDVPLHYVVRIKEQFVDATGIYTDRDAMMQVARLMYSTLLNNGHSLVLSNVDQETLNT